MERASGARRAFFRTVSVQLDGVVPQIAADIPTDLPSQILGARKAVPAELGPMATALAPPTTAAS